jgi:hypothetical protein
MTTSSSTRVNARLAAHPAAGRRTLLTGTRQPEVGNFRGMETL